MPWTNKKHREVQKALFVDTGTTEYGGGPSGRPLLYSGLVAGERLGHIHASTVNVHALEVGVTQRREGRCSPGGIEGEELLWRRRRRGGNETEQLERIIRHSSEVSKEPLHLPSAVPALAHPSLEPGFQLALEAGAWRHSVVRPLPGASLQLKVPRQHWKDTGGQHK